MNELQYYLEMLQQECNEVAQRVSKAKIFGTKEVQPDQELTNVERLNQELNDLFAVVTALKGLGINLYRDKKMIDDKLAKMKKFREYALKVNPNGE